MSETTQDEQTQDTGVQDQAGQVDGQAGDQQGAPEDTTAPATTGGRKARLEQEGEIAADYLEELLEIADLDGTSTWTSRATARPCRSWVRTCPS